MANDGSVTLRLEQETIEEADALCERIDNKLQAGRGVITRAAVMRMALSRGLAALREEYPPADDAAGGALPKPDATGVKSE